MLREDVDTQMAPKGFKCTAEITVELLVSPGTWLPNRDELYLTIDFFNQVKRTRLLEPVFPLRVHERFRFEKNFWPAADPQDVAEMLEELPISIELRQVTDVYLGSCLLAYLDASGREFLYPVATSSKPACHSGREALMARTVDFVGVSPKLEFCTYTAVEELKTSYSRTVGDDFGGEMTRPRQRALSQPRQRPPIAAAEDDDEGGRGGRRSRRRRDDPPPDDSAWAAAESQVVGNRPPFVVRHVERNLTGRTPALHNINTRLNLPRKLDGRPSGGEDSGGSSPVHDVRRRRRQLMQRSRSGSASSGGAAAGGADLWYYERPYLPFGHEYPDWGEGECLAPPVGRSLMDARYNPVLASSIRHRTADRYGEAPPPPQQQRRRPLRDSFAY